MVILDFHTHILPPSFQLNREDYLQRDATFRLLFTNPKAKLATAEQLLDGMDGAEVDMALAMGYGWTDTEVAKEANDYLLEAAARNPRRLVVLCSINPAWGQFAVDEIERCARGGAKGIGELHPDSQGIDITSPDTMAPVMETGRRLGLMVLTHSSEPVGHDYPGKGRTTPRRLFAFCRNFPHNRIVCAHWGGGLPFYTLMPEVDESLAHVYFDSAATPFLYHSSVYSSAVHTAGSQRILFGSDYPLLGYDRALGQLSEAGLPAEILEQILWGNASGLLGL